MLPKTFLKSFVINFRNFKNAFLTNYPISLRSFCEKFQAEIIENNFWRTEHGKRVQKNIKLKLWVNIQQVGKH